MLPISYVCSTCGHWISPLHGDPERCPREDNRRSHALSRELDPHPLRFPDLGPAHPFLRYRELLTVYHRARHNGMTDRAFVEAVMDSGEAPPEEQAEYWPTLSLQSGFLPEDAGIWVLASGREDGVDRRTRFAGALRRQLGSCDTTKVQSSIWTRESLRLRAYQFVSWTRMKGLSFDRILLSGHDRLLAVAWGEGLRDAARLMALPRSPRLHVVVREGDGIVAGYEETIGEILAAMHQDPVRRNVLEAARRDPRIRRQLSDSVRTGLRSETPHNPVRLAVERALSAVGSRTFYETGTAERITGESTYLILRSFVETGGFPVTVYDRTIEAAAEVLGEAMSSQANLVELLAAVLLLRTLGDIDPDERVCLVLP